ncbi:hypothetical protein [Fulvivirga imtechensis]|uniref:hypothetical protein n=1 Tax=Fulvivirga imtechensis TaxID=881893 RepID=UPI00058FFE59|nr:hypothetical protein [Fulvivirga imtechensis]
MKNKHWIIISIVIISGYSLYSNLSEDKKKKNWKRGDFKVLVQKCLKNAGKMTEDYPDLTKEYCECSIKEVQKKLTRKEYFKASSKNIERQIQILYPIFEDCLEAYKANIKQKKDEPI